MAVVDHPGLACEWQRLDALIEREIARLRARYQLSLDEFRGLYISDEQVDRLVRAGSESADIAAAPPSRGLASPLAVLGSALSLSSLEIDLVLLALAPEVDVKYETLFAYLHDDVTRRWPTGDLAVRLLRGAGASAAAVLRALAADAPLARLGVLRPLDPPGGRPSLANTGFALGREVVHFVAGVDALAPQLATFAHRGTPLRSPAPPPSARRARHLERLPALFAAERPEQRPVVVLLETAGSGAQEIAQWVAGVNGLDLLEVDLDLARGEPGWPRQIASALALHARLCPSVVLLRLGGASERIADVTTLVRAVHGAGAPVFIACDAESSWREVARSVRSIVVDIAPRDFSERLGVWSEALARAGVDLAPPSRAALAARFAIPPRHVELAVAAAVDVAELSGEPRPDMEALVSESARRLLDQHLGKLASKVATRWTWDDLVLPGLTRSRLEELASAIRHRHVVFDEWGFARRVGGGTGIKALFAGASGTGKTMSASVLAADLGFDLYRIDLSGVVSKYIGETEKNLDEIFRGARAGNAILFFDEADALFGKRSEVKDAHDRYANIEVAYLLQKLEDHDGIVVLATNLKRNIDDAFARRMQYVIDFPVPDVPARERLWRGMFPPGVPLADDVDCTFLARQFQISGGDIKNVALEAAFLAAQDSGVIGMRDLVRATARQLVKQGRMPSATDFQQYHGWLAAEAEARSA